MTIKQLDKMPSADPVPKKRKFAETAEPSGSEFSDNDSSSSDEKESTHEDTGNKGKMSVGVATCN